MFKKEKDLSPCADCYNLCGYELYYKGKRIKDEYTMKSTITVNLNNLTDEERKQLLNLVSKSHTEKKSKIWKPHVGNNYYCISYYGQVNDNVYISTVGSEHYKLGNCFKTREEAEFALEKQKLITEIKRYIAENDPDKLDFNNPIQPKYYLTYNYMTKEFSTVNSTAYMIWNNICFSTYFDWKKMISDIGEDSIKKYLFGVE